MDFGVGLPQSQKQESNASDFFDFGVPPPAVTQKQ